MTDDIFQLHAVGRVESPLTDPELAPKQGDEGAPAAWISFNPAVADAVADLRVGQEVLLLTWLHRARRDILSVRCRLSHTRPPVKVEWM